MTAPDTSAFAPIRTKHLPRFRRATLEERPAFRLTDRDRESLKIIYENRWITADMLQDLLSPVPLTLRQQEARGKLIAAKKANATGQTQRTKRAVLRRLSWRRSVSSRSGSVSGRALLDARRSPARRW